MLNDIPTATTQQGGTSGSTTNVINNLAGQAGISTTSQCLPNTFAFYKRFSIVNNIPKPAGRRSFAEFVMVDGQPAFFDDVLSLKPQGFTTQQSQKRLTHVTLSISA